MTPITKKILTMVKEETSLVERKEHVVKEDLDTQPREKQDGDANQLSEANPCVKNVVSVKTLAINRIIFSQTLPH